jgi:hypothetical protein
MVTLLQGIRCVTFIAPFLFVFLVTSCRTIKPYEKEYLLHPTMDDSRVGRVSAPYGQSIRPNERLAVAAGGASSYACPTCGGK